MITLHPSSSEKLWDKASSFLIKNISSDKKTIIFLSGGSATNIYGELGEFLKNADHQVAIAQVDERFQPQSDQSVNVHDIARTGLWKICNEKRIPYFHVSQLGTLHMAAKLYNDTVERCFDEYPYRMAVLGIGPDGHTAGLLPGYRSSWDISAAVAGYENKGLYPNRISLTPKTLKALDHAVVVVSGERKREALAHALDKKSAKDPNTYPAVVLQQIHKVDLFTDIAVTK